MEDKRCVLVFLYVDFSPGGLARVSPGGLARVSVRGREIRGPHVESVRSFLRTPSRTHS